jgi:DNA-binding transcriptional ArsR family regulator
VSPPRDAFAALADPTRRHILELLRDSPSLTAGEVAAAFPRISRPAVSKHLAVLRGAGLVSVRAEGREWHYSLDAGPLADIYQDWLLGFAPVWEETLGRLKIRAERPAASGKGRERTQASPLRR